MTRKRTLLDTTKDPLAKLKEDVGKTTNKKKPADVETKMLNTRIPKDLIKKVKVYCASNEITVQDFITEIISERLGK